MSNDGGPAFPACSEANVNETMGMSLLDYFAGQALSSFALDRTQICRETADDIAFMAYRIAHAMLSYKQKQQAVSESQQVALGIGGET